MNQLAGAGVDPDAVTPDELAQARRGARPIPRSAFDEAIARDGEPGFSADPYLAQETASDAASSTR